MGIAKIYVLFFTSYVTYSYLIFPPLQFGNGLSFRSMFQSSTEIQPSAYVSLTRFQCGGWFLSVSCRIYKQCPKSKQLFLSTDNLFPSILRICFVSTEYLFPSIEDLEHASLTEQTLIMVRVGW